jgi:ADP-dependent NAD(P)H-hydrate dehydratase / NAD(P)H-hydrate epimerase
VAQVLTRVVGAAEAAARDGAAIAAGIPSRALMQRAGAAAAAEIALRFPERLGEDVAVLAGPGNNGGDGWVIARALAATGVSVRVIEPLPARTPDCFAERALALSSVRHGDGPLVERLVIDALLGTGASGAPRDALAQKVKAIADARDGGSTIVAIDLPTGIDATGGATALHVSAHLTLTFGTLKRGHLVARGACGRIVVLDIGLGDFAELDDGMPVAIDERWVAARLPPIPHDAHKGMRGRVAILGGGVGMAGAAILAARAAARSGAGLVRVLCAPQTVQAVLSAEPAALVAEWPTDDISLGRDLVEWADVVAIGPGLGNTPASRALVERVLGAFGGPVVMDADAINVFAGDADALAPLLRGRDALLTPHPLELSRLLATDAADIAARRFDVGRDAARRTGATVLLKGAPTVISSPGGTSMVSVSGSSVLATGGSGDLLTGMTATLMSQGLAASVAGACGAWIHGRAAVLASEAMRTNLSRGVTLEDVVANLPAAWQVQHRPTRYPVLLEIEPAS